MTTEQPLHHSVHNPSHDAMPVCAPGWLCLHESATGHWVMHLRTLSLPRRDLVRATMVCDDFGNLVAVSDAALDAAYYSLHRDAH